MATFAYVVRDRAGQELSGFLAAGSVDEVIRDLHRQDLTVLNVREDRPGGARSLREQLAQISFGRTGTRDLALFNRQFATVLEAGIPLVRGLRALGSDSTSPVLRRALSDVATRIEQGEHLSDAMSAHPECFNGMYLSMVRAGERAGTLDQIVEQLAVYLEKVDAIKTKVRAALAYPIFVLAFAVLVTLFLLFQIVPTFSEIYAQFGADLPVVTRAVVGASDVVRANIVLTGLVALAIAALFVMAFRTPGGRTVFDSMLLRLPVFGPLVRKGVMSRFARTFAILLRSGLPLLEALELVRGAVGNVVIGTAVGQAKERVESGRAITDSFRATGKFPDMVMQMMATGEEAGDLDSMLMKTSDFYDRQVEATVQGLSSLIEPLMIMVVGALIGVIVISMFLPIFHLGEAVMRGGFNV